MQLEALDSSAVESAVHEMEHKRQAALEAVMRRAHAEGLGIQISGATGANAGIIMINSLFCCADMEGAALKLYNTINSVVIAKSEAGEITIEDEADIYTNNITAAFTEACLDGKVGGEDDFREALEGKSSKGVAAAGCLGALQRHRSCLY